ncbi:MAG: HAD-IA family hydrolase [Lachnospiraceae bacterium]|nr:HAD-IA family hydrolase [Lachnospiraceae bacterium]
MNNIKHIIFDVDGTMLDTSEGMISSVKYMINEMGYVMPDEMTLESFVGPRIQDSLVRVFGIEGEELNKAASVFRNRYKEGDVLLASPYDGLEDVLRHLKEKEYTLTIATNKRQDFVDALLDKFDLSKYFTKVYGTDMQGKYTKTDLIMKCLEFCDDINNNETVLIGDSRYDAIAAKEAGILFLGCLYGYDFKTIESIEQYNPIAVIDDITELISILC